MNERGSSRERASSRAAPPATLGIKPWRLVALVVALIAAGSGLTFRLAFYQIVDHSQLIAAAASERSGTSSIPEIRGVIYDDAGNPLAVDEEVYDVYASPNQIAQPVAEAHILAKILHVPPGPLGSTLSRRITYVKIAGHVGQAVADRIQKKGLIGITLQPSPNRVYPEGNLAAQVIGFVESGGVGQYGLEQQYDPWLSGAASTSSLLRVSKIEGDSSKIDRSALRDQGPGTGASLYLSVDTYVQDVAEQDLIGTIRRSGAVSGTVIIANPRSGRVLAMANYPSFNPNRYSASPVSRWKNAAISNTYEPGSTFKIVTMAGGLSERVITPRTRIYDPGYHSYPPCITVHNWDYPTVNGPETMTQVLQHSANVGAAFVANRLGSHRFYRYVQAFGVGAPTGVDLQGEATGFVPLPGGRGSNWSCGNLYANSYGQSLTVTPLQLITAVNAVANGGWLMRPEVVARIEYHGVSVYRRPHKIRRVINSTTATTLTRMLVQSAIGPPGQFGEASCALVPGYQVAAKTGTANIADARGGGYLHGSGSTIASTVGYAPADRPRFSVLAVIRQPRSSPFGSEIAAPLVHNLFQALFLRYHIAPSSPAGPVRRSQAAFGCPS